MKYKATYLYKLATAKMPVSIYYIVILGLMLLTLILRMVLPNMDGSFTGLELSSIIFLFIFGLNSFKEDFHFSLQNGVSRRTQFLASMGIFATVSLIFTLIDRVIIASLSLYVLGGEGYVGFYDALYQLNIGKISLPSLLFAFLLYFLAIAGGYFLTLLYYRMNRTLKVIFSVFVPVFLIIIFPILNSFSGGEIGRIIVQGFIQVMGIGIGGNSIPALGMLTLLVGSAGFSGLSWLLMRRATIKG